MLCTKEYTENISSRYPHRGCGVGMGPDPIRGSTRESETHRYSHRGNQHGMFRSLRKKKSGLMVQWNQIRRPTCCVGAIILQRTSGKGGRLDRSIAQGRIANGGLGNIGKDLKRDSGDLHGAQLTYPVEHACDPR